MLHYSPKLFVSLKQDLNLDDWLQRLYNKWEASGPSLLPI